MTTFSPLCQLNGGCLGCCGHDFVAEKLAEAVTVNTTEFQEWKPQKEKEFLTFRDRRPPTDLREGLCRNLIQEKGCLICPLHPTRHFGTDLRIGHCDAGHLCDTAKCFAQWQPKKQEDFVMFVEGKKLTNIGYSLKMAEGELLKDFLEKYNFNSLI